MPKIEIVTEINAEIHLCFDLARSIDLHQISTSHTQERAIAGVTSGLIGLQESVTWQATHFGIRQKLTAIITKFERPFHFRDEQLKGIFKAFCHDHFFEKIGKKTLMKDVFEFHSPFGVLGNVFNYLVLTNYMRRFLVKRNQIIKEFAESDKWKLVLKGNI